jgi:dextranase
MKKARPDKLLVMNAVSNYGSSEIISTGNVEFSYTELWGSEESYWDMERMVREHAEVDGRGTASVFAAYMDYNRRDNGGEYFNTPGILLTDATMFAVGGSHLELGDGHMLCAEYFPNSNLRMSDELISSLTKYYDFMTAYENYLRDGGSVVDPQISCTNGVVDINRWPPSTGRVTAYSRQLDGRKVINLLNFSSTRDEKHTLLRDVDGDMPEPALKQNIKVKVYSEKASKVWVASPDRFDGVPQQLSFSRSGNYIEFNVPSLKYWTMIVIEQDGSVEPTPEPTPSDYTSLYLVGDNTPGQWRLWEATPLVQAGNTF